HGPGRIRSKNELRGAHTRFRRKTLLNPFTQPEFQSVSGLLIGRQNNDLGKIGVREFWIVRKEEARSARPNVSRNNLCFGLEPQPLLDFFRTRVGSFYARALWLLHLHQEFRPVGLRKELLFDKSHACEGSKKESQNNASNQNLSAYRPGN